VIARHPAPRRRPHYRFRKYDLLAFGRPLYDRQAKERLKTNTGGNHQGLAPVNLPEAKADARDAAGKAVGGAPIPQAETSSCRKRALVAGELVFKSVRCNVRIAYFAPMCTYDTLQQIQLEGLVPARACWFDPSRAHSKNTYENITAGPVQNRTGLCF
jgi:hypothetical protein